MSQRNKGKHFSSTESPAETLDLPFSADSLAQVLDNAVSDNPCFTHQQISDWAWRFWWECDEGSLAEITENNLKLAAAAEVALDIDTQWELFLVNTYSVEQLQTVDFSRIELPRQWFKEWMARLD